MLYLASQSPRRAELLSQIGVPFTVVDARVDESWLPAETLDHYVARVSALKAREAARSLSPDAIILAADTAGICGEHRLVKPGNRNEALAMLGRMSGRAHTVSTAITLFQPTLQTVETRVVSSLVQFRILTPEECEAYWDTGEPCDKAGSYAIQGLGAVFVQRLEGSYSGVMGLPLCETALLLRQSGIPVWQSRQTDPAIPPDSPITQHIRQP